MSTTYHPQKANQMNTPTGSDKRAADAIYEATWGTREAIWPGVDAITQIIAYHMAAEREALRLLMDVVKEINTEQGRIERHGFNCPYCGLEDGHESNCTIKRVRSALCSPALAAIEKMLP